MNPRRQRIGVFGRGTSPGDGGSDTLLGTIAANLPALGAAGEVEIVPVPWSAWSHRRRPWRYAWCRLVRYCGGEWPLVDLRPVCRRYRIDVAYLAAPAFVRIDVPFVFSVWDLGHRTIPEFPEMRSGRDPWTHREALYRTMLGQASFVVVGNRTGAAEVRAIYGLPADKVIALPFPNPDFSGVAEETPAGLPAARFFVYPAQFWPHKNHFTLLHALAHLEREGGEATGRPHLILAGADKGNAAYLRTTARELGLAERVHFPGLVSRGELKALYRRAAGLVFPSLLGPNNLPPQEAAVLDCPMVLSDLPGHREQLGEGALYAAPLEAAAWAGAMRQLLTDDALRPSLCGRARAAVAGCTPEAYAAGIASLLGQLVARRRLWPAGH
ncbi:MAG: glycosyltransferase family 4 protein [Verrucomicrobia bacterium]|nr:glycosyltransferase family 4 protein [Verrucomicrobiota bacterium]